MIRINLIRERTPGARKATVAAGPSDGPNPLVLGGMAAILLIGLGIDAVWYFTLKSDITRKENTKQELEREKQRLEPIIKQKEELERKREDLERRIAVIKELRKRQEAPVRLLDELSKNLPDYVWFETVTESNLQITIDGRSLNPTKMADYVDNLTHSPYFSNVNLIQYRQDPQDGTVRFNLATTFVLPEPAGNETNGAGP